MSGATLPETIELDGVAELFRCPDSRNGWSAADIRIEYNRDTWHLSGKYGHLRDEWERLHPNERSDPKIALREVRLDPTGQPVFRLQLTEWREVRPLHEVEGLGKDSFLRCHTDGYEMLLPNIGVVHVIAATSDSRLLVLRRSDSVHYYPGSWSASYEEGLAPEDMDGAAVFQRAARRGLTEELTTQGSGVSLEAFKLVSVVLERPLNSPVVIVVADLPMTHHDLPTEPPSAELDAMSLIALPIDRELLRDAIVAPDPVLVGQRGRWHPTARYRLLVGLAHFFGEKVAAETLFQVQSNGSRGEK